MDLVRFPGLEFEIIVPKVAFKLLGVNIYYYAICIVIGICISLILSRISKEKFGINYDNVIELVVWTIIIGYIGARIYYVIFNLDNYINNPIKILSIRDGGLAVYGGIIFAVIFLFIKCIKENIDFLNLCDYLAPFLAIAQSIGRWGNFFNKEAYGYETSIFLRMGIYNNYGEYIEVHPTFLYESICTFLIFLLLRRMQKNRKYKGQIFYCYVVFYSFIRFFIEWLRSDSLMLGSIRISQILSLIFFVFFSYLLLKNRRKKSY